MQVSGNLPHISENLKVFISNKVHRRCCIEIKQIEKAENRLTVAYFINAK